MRPPSGAAGSKRCSPISSPISTSPRRCRFRVEEFEERLRRIRREAVVAGHDALIVHTDMVGWFHTSNAYLRYVCDWMREGVLIIPTDSDKPLMLLSFFTQSVHPAAGRRAGAGRGHLADRRDRPRICRPARLVHRQDRREPAQSCSADLGLGQRPDRPARRPHAPTHSGPVWRSCCRKAKFVARQRHHRPHAEGPLAARDRDVPRRGAARSASAPRPPITSPGPA